MELYLVGVGVALLIGVVKVGVARSTRFSIRAKNLRKLGLHYRAGRGTFEQEGTAVSGWIALVIWLLVVAPLGSWLCVASAAWTYFSAKRKQVPIPEKVKVIQDLMARHELSREALIEAQEEMHRVTGQPGAVLTGEEHEAPAYLVLENDEGWWSEVRANPGAKTLVFYGHTDDHHSEFHSVEEYRFAGERVLSRLLEDYVDHLGKEEWHVKDGVVLESQMRKRAEERRISLTPVDEEIARYRVQLEWRPIQNRKLRFFVMAQHPAEYPLRDRRRLIRSELERLEAGARKIVEEAKKQGLNVQDGEKGPELRYPEGFTEEDRDRVRKVFSDAYFAAVGMTADELSTFKLIRADLLKLLGEPVPG